MRMVCSVAVCAVATLVATSCGGRSSDADAKAATGWTPTRGETVMGVAASAVQSSIQRALVTRPNAMTPRQWTYVQRLYLTYGHAPLWLEAQGFHETRSAALLGAVVEASSDALNLDRYPLDDLISAVSTVRAATPPTAPQLAAADILLTSTYIALAEDLLTGQLDPKALAQDWHIAVNREPVDSAVARSLRDARLDSAIARMRPRDPEYDALRRALFRFRTIVDRGGWPVVPPGKALSPGQTDHAPRLTALRERLRREGVGAPRGDTAAPVRPVVRGAARYDAELAGLVAAYQARHGIAVDSLLGAETLTSLNVPASYRLAQIAANLERYRWMPRAIGGRYIVVNVPAFRLEAHDANGTLAMKVIVGEEFDGRQTPVFADSMETVVFRPYWNITPNIQANETAPKIAADPNYMAANDLEYFTDGGVRRIRQTPGPKNSLGLVKFLFPNTFNIYLHDTPQGELFDKDVRAFSHGCIRLEHPDALAQWVLGWDAARVAAAMQSGKDNQATRLPQKIPVYIVYSTVYERDGQLYFGNDLYSRDDALVQALSQSLTPTEHALRRLSALRALVGQ